MGIPLFSALGQLGSQWGQAKEETVQENLRTQQIAAQLKRQDAMQQLAQQRATMEQTRIGLEQDRATAEAKYHQQQQDLEKAKGWEKPYIYEVGGKKYKKNAITGEIQPADPGMETESEKWKREHGPESKDPQYELRLNDKGELKWYRKPTGGPSIISTGEKGMPRAGDVNALTPQDLQKGYQDVADMVIGGMDYTKATSNLPKNGKLIVDRLLHARGYMAPTEHTTQNMNTLSSIQQFEPVMNALEDVLNSIDPQTGRPLRENNTVSAAARERWQWFLYNTMGTKPSDPLLSAAIGYGSFAKIAGTTPWMRAGRGAYIMSLIQQHLPDPEKNTPAAMWDRLQRLRLLLGKQANILQVITLGGIRQPDGRVKPIGDIDPSMITPSPGQGAPGVNPSDYPDPTSPPPQ